MRKHLAAVLTAVAVLALPVAASAQGQKKELKDQALGKKESSITPDKSLAGDISRKKEDKDAAPALQYDQYRLGVEMQVASKRQEQLESIKRIIGYGPDKKEAPGLHFRYGELLWEESKYWFFEANRQDDEYIRAMNRQDKAAMESAKAQKNELLAKSKAFANEAVEQYSTIVQQYKDFERTDEVLYFLGMNLMEQGEDKKALVAYKRLIEKYGKSKFVPDAHLAFGEYYFNNSKGKREMLEKALASYKEAAAFPENRVYAYALYKQGWCYFNMADYNSAKDMFKTVVLLGKVIETEKDDGKKGGKKGLVKEARTDYVRAYAREGEPMSAKAEFSKLAEVEEDRFNMMKGLANLYYEDGKDKEAALIYNTLIKEKPLSPEAPGWQGKIVDCVLRAGNKKMTVDQVRRLVKIHDDIVKTPGILKTEKDKKALEEARELSERTLSNLAVTWHNEAKKTRDEQTFFFANEVYGDYLTLFPESNKSYDLRFFWAELLNDNLQKFPEAAQQYTLVMLQDVKRIEGKSEEKDKDGKKVTKAGKYMNNAAYNAILAWDEVVKAAEAAGQIKSESTADNKPVKIPELKKNLLDACERYLKYVKEGDKRVEIAFKAANIYYRYNHFDEAVKRFAEMIEKDPDYKFENGDRAAEIAANLILDTYNLLGDWAKVNEWARKFYKNEKLAVGKFRDDLSKVLEQSSFKLVNQLEANKEYAKAAEAYLVFVSEFPKSDIADKALFNASIDFYNAKMNDRAIQVRNNIIENYPKSEFVPQCIYANAEALESITDFESAAKYYELYVSRWEKATGKKGDAPKKKAKGVKFSKKGGKKGSDKKPQASDKQVWDEAKAQVALFNAGIFRDGLGQYAQALKNREKYLALWDDAKDADAVFLSIADLHEKYGKYGKAIQQLEEYEKEHLKDPNKVLMCEGRIERLYATKLNKKKDSQRINKRVLDYYEKLNKKQKEGLDGAAREAVGRAHFEKNADEYAFYARMKLGWGSPPTPNGVKKSIGEKVKSLEQVQRLYTETVKIKAADPAICALHQIGLAYVNMADSVEKIAIPKKLAVPGVGMAPVPPELEEEIRLQFTQQAVPLKEKAAEAFAAAVSKSHELDVSNECSQKSLSLLRETYKPEQFPPVPEQIVEIKGLKAQAVGGDFLAALQPIPVVSAAQLKENQEKAKALKADVKDLKAQDRAPDEDPPPRDEVDPAPREDEEPRGPVNNTKQNKSSGDEEPEDAI